MWLYEEEGRELDGTSCNGLDTAIQLVLSAAVRVCGWAGHKFAMYSAAWYSGLIRR